MFIFMSITISGQVLLALDISEFMPIDNAKMHHQQIDSNNLPCDACEVKVCQHQQCTGSVCTLCMICSFFIIILFLISTISSKYKWQRILNTSYLPSHLYTLFRPPKI